MFLIYKSVRGVVVQGMRGLWWRDRDMVVELEDCLPKTVYLIIANYRAWIKKCIKENGI